MLLKRWNNVRHIEQQATCFTEYTAILIWLLLTTGIVFMKQPLLVMLCMANSNIICISTKHLKFRIEYSIILNMNTRNGNKMDTKSGLTELKVYLESNLWSKGSSYALPTMWEMAKRTQCFHDQSTCHRKR